MRTSNLIRETVHNTPYIHFEHLVKYAHLIIS